MAGYDVSSDFFLGKDDTRIFFHSWRKVVPAAAVVIVHGVGEHGGRYMNLISAMQGDNVSFYAHDLRGHGRSDGQRGHVDSFSQYIEDLKVFRDLVWEENKTLPVILLGHSLGGLIAFQYALTYPQDFGGLILSAAALTPFEKLPAWQIVMIRLFSRIRPTSFETSKFDPHFLSHDKEAVDAYINDPLVHDQMSYRWGTEFLRAGVECLKRASELEMPLLITHGTEDRVVDVQGSKETMARASSQDKRLILYEGLYHETMNEVSPEKERVLADLREWILEHV